MQRDATTIANEAGITVIVRRSSLVALPSAGIEVVAVVRRCVCQLHSSPCGRRGSSS